MLPETYLQTRYKDNPAAQAEAIKTLVTQTHLLTALSKIRPSVSLAELRNYEALRDKYLN